MWVLRRGSKNGTERRQGPPRAITKSSLKELGDDVPAKTRATGFLGCGNPREW